MKKNETKEDPKRPGQPSKLTKEVKERLFTAIAAGCNLKESCAYAQISHTTLGKWKEKGENGKAKEYVEFVAELTRAREAGRARLQILISKAAEKDWHAASWQLACEDSQRFSPKNRVEISEGKEEVMAADRKLLDDIARDERSTELFFELTDCILDQRKARNIRDPSFER